MMNHYISLMEYRQRVEEAERQYEQSRWLRDLPRKPSRFRVMRRMLQRWLMIVLARLMARKPARAGSESPEVNAGRGQTVPEIG